MLVAPAEAEARHSLQPLETAAVGAGHSAAIVASVAAAAAAAAVVACQRTCSLATGPGHEAAEVAYLQAAAVQSCQNREPPE